MTYPTDEAYFSKWKKIVNVMQHSNLGLARIAPHGSRARHLHRPDSDMDVIFVISGNPSRSNFYPELVRIISANFREDAVYEGTDYNIIHLDFHTGPKFDIILLTDVEFDREYEDVLNFRRNNL